jgi:hypothetical protein
MYGYSIYFLHTPGASSYIHLLEVFALFSHGKAWKTRESHLLTKKKGKLWDHFQTIR